jgi:KDO2-lipid IV(A) lauroyltransferase
MPSDSSFWKTRLAPLRFLIAWFVYLLLRTLVLLPFRWQIALGKSLGALARRLLPDRALTVARNLEVCFPERSAAEREAIAKAHFEALGASAFEMAMAWFGTLEKLRRLIRIEGREHLEQALARGRGVILYSAHFTTMEIGFPVARPLCGRFAGMYKTQRNPLMNKVMTRARRRSADVQIEKESVRQMLRELAANAAVFYAADQSFTGKGAALIPFFGEPAMTNTAISRLARMSGATVIPYFLRRLPDELTYVLHFGSPLEGFPSDDAVADTRRLVARLEAFIRTCPEQYWWVHQRFKGRPAPFPDIYARDRQETVADSGHH